MSDAPAPPAALPRIAPGQTVRLQRSPRTGGAPVVAGSPLWHKTGEVISVQHTEPFGGFTAHVAFTFGADDLKRKAVLEIGLDYLKAIQ